VGTLSRAFVTGATGFVGYHLVSALLRRGVAVRALVRPRSPASDLVSLYDARREAPCATIAEAAARSECVVGDLADTQVLRDGISGCDTVYHVAADYRLWARDPSAMYRTNVEGTMNVLRAAEEAGAARIVYTSTVGTLGIPADGSAGTEDTPVRLEDMVGHYKRSKFVAEASARAYAGERGLNLVVVYPSTPVGERDKRPTPTGRIVVDFLKGRLPAYVDTGLNLVDVRDVAEGHILAAERGAPGRGYILGNTNLTLRDVLAELAAVTGEPAPTVRIPYWCAFAFAVADTLWSGCVCGREPRASLDAVRMARKCMFFDSSRAVRELQMPQSPIRPALRRSAEWFVAHGYCAPRTALAGGQA